MVPSPSPFFNRSGWLLIPGGAVHLELWDLLVLGTMVGASSGAALPRLNVLFCFFRAQLRAPAGNSGCLSPVPGRTRSIAIGQASAKRTLSPDRFRQRGQPLSSNRGRHVARRPTQTKHQIRKPSVTSAAVFHPQPSPLSARKGFTRSTCTWSHRRLQRGPVCASTDSAKLRGAFDA